MFNFPDSLVMSPSHVSDRQMEAGDDGSRTWHHQKRLSDVGHPEALCRNIKTCSIFQVSSCMNKMLT